MTEPSAEGSKTPRTDALSGSLSALNPERATERLLEHANELESDLTALRSAADASDEAARKYASELQHLCDAIIGGQNVTAPFSGVLEKANYLRRYAEARKEGA